MLSKQHFIENLEQKTRFIVPNEEIRNSLVKLTCINIINTDSGIVACPKVKFNSNVLTFPEINRVLFYPYEVEIDDNPDYTPLASIVSEQVICYFNILMQVISDIKSVNLHSISIFSSSVGFSLEMPENPVKVSIITDVNNLSKFNSEELTRFIGDKARHIGNATDILSVDLDSDSVDIMLGSCLNVVYNGKAYFIFAIAKLSSSKFANIVLDSNYNQVNNSDSLKIIAKSKL